MRPFLAPPAEETCYTCQVPLSWHLGESGPGRCPGKDVTRPFRALCESVSSLAADVAKLTAAFQSFAAGTADAWHDDAVMIIRQISTVEGRMQSFLRSVLEQSADQLAAPAQPLLPIQEEERAARQMRRDTSSVGQAVTAATSSGQHVTGRCAAARLSPLDSERTWKLVRVKLPKKKVVLYVGNVHVPEEEPLYAARRLEQYVYERYDAIGLRRPVIYNSKAFIYCARQKRCGVRLTIEQTDSKRMLQRSFWPRLVYARPWNFS